MTPILVLHFSMASCSMIIDGLVVLAGKQVLINFWPSAWKG
jgi:hypothetical protein